MAEARNPGALELPNIRHFIAFRVCFNARFYYPIFAVLFLDFGLSLEQFALLNAVWAATIVLLEVPSGALADIIGRRRLLVGAAALMVAEMTLLCLAPRGNPPVLFVFFLVNRILSGAAEAAASGADEALAYDTLKNTGRAQDWGMVLERQIRYQAIGFIVAMSIGAAVYDPDLLNRLLAWGSATLRVDQEMTLRFPLYLTLIMALVTLYQAVAMKETQIDPSPANHRSVTPPPRPCGKHLDSLSGPAAGFCNHVLRFWLFWPVCSSITSFAW